MPLFPYFSVEGQNISFSHAQWLMDGSAVAQW